MPSETDLRWTMQKAREIVDTCAEQITHTVAAGGMWDEDDGPKLMEQTILTLILAGLQARAARRGIEWSKVEADSRVALLHAADLPATDAIQ